MTVQQPDQSTTPAPITDADHEQPSMLPFTLCFASAFLIFYLTCVSPDTLHALVHTLLRR